MVMEFKLLGELISSTAIIGHGLKMRRSDWVKQCEVKLCFKSNIALNWLCKCSPRLWETWEWSNRDSCQSDLPLTECLCQGITVRKVWRASSGRGVSSVRVFGGSRPARISSRQSTRGWGSIMWGRWGRLRRLTSSMASTARLWRTLSSLVGPQSSWWANTPLARRHSSGDSWVWIALSTLLLDIC